MKSPTFLTMGAMFRSLRFCMRKKERVKGFEPSTATLATWCSTTELHPRAGMYRSGRDVLFQKQHVLAVLEDYVFLFAEVKGTTRSKSWISETFFIFFSPDRPRKARFWPTLSIDLILGPHNSFIFPSAKARCSFATC